MRLGPIHPCPRLPARGLPAAGRLRLGRLDRQLGREAPKTARRRRRAISRPPKGARSPRSWKRPAPRNSSSPRPASVFYKGENRFPFGVFEKDRTQVNDAEVALYLSPVPEGQPESRERGSQGGRRPGPGSKPSKNRRPAPSRPRSKPWPPSPPSARRRPARTPTRRRWSTRPTSTSPATGSGGSRP